MIFNIDKETMPREEIRKIQLERLQDLCRRVYANVPLYRRSLDEKGIKPADVQSLDDLKHLPFTLKQDMRDNYPYGLFAVPMEMIERIHASSGTTGKATVVGYTKRDIEVWAECAARSLAAAGATANDIVQVSYGYGLFTGGLGAHYGAERLGATVIPMSGGSTKRQVQLMRDFGSMQSPMNAYMLNLGLESLHVRMQRHCANGMAVAKFLEAHPKVAYVNYCGLESSPYHALAEKYLPNGSCGVVSFGLAGGREAASTFMKELKLAAIETHVADARTCCLNPASSTHRQMNDEQLAAAGVPAELVRMSCGLESSEDLIADIAQALDKIYSSLRF